MSYFKIDEENFAKIRNDLRTSMAMFENCMSQARTFANAEEKLTSANRTLVKRDRDDQILWNYTNRATNYNSALSTLRSELATPTSGDITQAERTVPAMTAILNAASEYNGTDISEFEKVSFDIIDQDYEPNIVDSIVGGARDVISFTEGLPVGTEQGEKNYTYTGDTDPNMDDWVDERRRQEPEPDPKPKPDPEPNPDPEDDKKKKKKTDPDETQEDDPSKDPGGTGAGRGGIIPTPDFDNMDEDKHFTPGDTSPEGPGGIVGKTESIAEVLVNTDDTEDTGAEMADVVKFGLGGAGSLILGLTDSNNNNTSFLNGFINRVSERNDERSLEKVDLDVFDHPDYTKAQSETEMKSSGVGSLGGGYGSSANLEEPEINSEFSIKQANELEDGEMPEGSGDGSGLGKGVAALAGAAAIGGAAAGIAVGIDAEQNGSGEKEYGSSDDYLGEKNLSLGAMFFGTLKDEDPVKQKKQEIMERVAVIVTAASAAATFGTFILANMDVINPIWFLIATLMIGASYVYFDIVKEQKYKRKQELEAMGKIVKTTKPYFGIKDKKLVKVTNNKDDIKEPDWILLGMSLLSSSAFILKTFDVISWLIFLLLLILFVLIIVVYIILKKKLGEE